MAKRKKTTDPKVAERRAARRAAQQALADGGAAAPLRPFEGLPGEADWVALREVVPAASATARTTAEHGSVDILVVTLLPRLWPAMKRSDGVVLVALQTASSSEDPSRDVAAALLQVLDAEPGTALEHIDLPESGPRLQDVLDLDVPFEVTVHDTFSYTVPEDGSAPDEAAAALEEAAGGIVPTVKIDAVDAGYWCRMGEREFLRWARPEEPERLFDALARLHADRASAFDDGSRFVGAFRSCGILVPVWELTPGAEAADIEKPVAAFAPTLEAALASTDPLTPEQRRARAGLVSRQVSLR
ncbi:DUF5926 family protein [Pseudactinotalea sp.]|uniref:DUF5926 family protein n=1 Tax=Pseudactinotalea sp. TaxID=1926260 RepID=UPI003B3BA5B2